MLTKIAFNSKRALIWIRGHACIDTYHFRHVELLCGIHLLRDILCSGSTYFAQKLDSNSSSHCKIDASDYHKTNISKQKLKLKWKKYSDLNTVFSLVWDREPLNSFFDNFMRKSYLSSTRIHSTYSYCVYSLLSLWPTPLLRCIELISFQNILNSRNYSI